MSITQEGPKESCLGKPLRFKLVYELPGVGFLFTCAYNGGCGGIGGREGDWDGVREVYRSVGGS